MTRRRSSTITRRIPHTGGAGVSPAVPPAVPPGSFNLPPLDPALLVSVLSNLHDTKRSLIHSIASVADRIPHIITFMDRAVDSINLASDTIAFTLASLSPEART